MDVGEVFKAHLGADQQGQLVIKFAGEDHLCKISIEDGQAVYLTLGNKGPLETLDEIVGKTAEWSNFIKGLPARKRLDEPINQLLLNIAGAGTPATGEEPTAGEVPTEEPVLTVSSEEVDALRVDKTIDQFIDLIGPLGTILTEKVCSNLSYTIGNKMSGDIYVRFVTALADEVPEGERQGFIASSAP